MNLRKLTPSMSLLLAFEAAGRHQSYTRAGQELALTQSAVSRQVQALEQWLDLKLFERDGRGIVFTDVGRTYHAEISRSLGLVRNATLDALSFHAKGGVLRLGTLPTFGAKWLLPRLHRFYEAHPSVQIDLHSRIEEIDFASSDLDAAIVVGAVPKAGANALRLKSEEMILVGQPGLFKGKRGKGDVQAVLKENMLLRVASYPGAWAAWSAALGLDAVRPRLGPGFELTSHLIQAVCAGMGIGLVPAMFVEDELRDGRLASPFKAVESGRSYYLVSSDRSGNRSALADFRQWLQSEVASAALGLHTAR